MARWFVNVFNATGFHNDYESFILKVRITEQSDFYGKNLKKTLIINAKFRQ